MTSTRPAPHARKQKPSASHNNARLLHACWRPLKRRRPMADSAVAITAGSGTNIKILSVCKEWRKNKSCINVNNVFLQFSCVLLWLALIVNTTRVLKNIDDTDDTAVYAAYDCLANSTSAPTSGGFTFANAARI